MAALVRRLGTVSVQSLQNTLGLRDVQAFHSDGRLAALLDLDLLFLCIDIDLVIVV